MPEGSPIYRLTELPDPACPCFQLRTGTDAQAACRASGEHLLRTFVEFGPDSAVLALRFVYRPVAASAAESQDRLAIYLAGCAENKDTAVALELLLDRGPFQRLFSLVPAKHTTFEWDSFRAGCDVVRRQSILEPTVTTEFNVKALPAYYTIRSFEPRWDNDYLQLDNVLDRVTEPVVIDISIQPVDIASQLSLHTRYLSRLQEINRPWDIDEDDYLSVGCGGSAREWRSALRPLHHKDLVVDEVIRQQRRFHETLTQPHLQFHIRVLALTPAVARLLASVVAESAFDEGSYQLFSSASGEPLFQKMLHNDKHPRVLPAETRERLLGDRRINSFDGLFAMANVAPTDQLLSVFRMPLASRNSPRCIRKITDSPRENIVDLVIVGCDAGGDAQLPNGTGGALRGIQKGNLVKHFLCSGMPGYGKTITIFGLLYQLNRLGIPFIVLETGKSEYRRLKCLRDHQDDGLREFARDLQIYTPGSEVSPLRINPLCFPSGITVNEHIEQVLACFRAAMPMGGPLPALLAEALEWVYSDTAFAAQQPRMTHLHAKVGQVLASKNYTAEPDANLRAALEVRVDDLTRRASGRVFGCDQDVPALDRLITGSTIIELDSLPPELACLLALFHLTKIREYIRCTPWSGHNVRLVIILEEAHNIVGRSNDASPSEENADPKAYASEFICRMLAELRALGVSIGIVDQFPAALAPQVIWSTASKFSFRQVDNENREVIGGAMLFGNTEMEEIARLKPGEAFFHTEAYFGPQRIRTRNLQAEWDLPAPPVGEAILPYLSEDRWFVEAAATRIEGELTELVSALDAFDDVRARIASQTKSLVAEYLEIIAASGAERQGRRLSGLARKAQALRDQLDSSFRTFRRDVYLPLVGTGPRDDVGTESLRAWQKSCVSRFEHAIEPATSACIGALDNLIQKCGADQGAS